MFVKIATVLLSAALIAGMLLASAMPVSAHPPCVGAGPGYETFTKPGVVYTTDVHHLNICGAKNIFMGTWLKWKSFAGPADLALRITQPDGVVAYIDNNNPPGNYEGYIGWAPLAPGDWTFEVINKSDVPATYRLIFDFWYYPIS